MGRRTASAETLKPDPRFDSKLASKFINCLMWQGKKGTAECNLYRALDQIKKRMPDADSLEVFTQAVEHVKPSVEVRSKRVGGATYQVPMQVNKTAPAEPCHSLADPGLASQGGSSHVSAACR